jgi:hypothetical protein
MTSRGFPYLRKAEWDVFRDTVPHLLGMGQRVLGLIDRAEVLAAAAGVDAAARDHCLRACRVARQVVQTASITAPPDLWLLRHVLGFFSELGLSERLARGGAIYVRSCVVQTKSGPVTLDAGQLETDLNFLLARGVVEQYEDSYRMAGHPRVGRLLSEIGPVIGVPISATSLWRRVFACEEVSAGELEVLLDLTSSVQAREDVRQNHWIPTVEEVQLGYRLVPIVLALRATDRTASLTEGVQVTARQLCPTHAPCCGGALSVLVAAGWMERRGEGCQVTALGARGFARGPGPFGIIETYHAYMAKGAQVLVEGRKGAWVNRSENVGASQDANRRTFARANDALDRFCAETGFSYSVFIEHAIGHGEATRQRYERSGDTGLSYFGADLEDAAIDAAIEQQSRGLLPPGMVFVRSADIGEPNVLIESIRAHNLDPAGSVMLVGNGFHEVRNQTDDNMAAVFRGYHDAGVLLLFTEENALSVDDLRATAWNTYHAGFKYVHEKSGQGLRPAEPAPFSRLGRQLRAAWSECARAAGYVRAGAYCHRTRTVYPYTPASGHNPAISVNHFFVPAQFAAQVGLCGAHTEGAREEG